MLVGHHTSETTWMDNLTKVMKKTIGMNLQKVTLNQIFHNVKKGMNLNLKTELSTRASGKEVKDTVLDNKFGQMVLSMKANGKKIRLMAREYFGMYMETNTKGNGRETKPTDKENILIVTVLHMKECGKMIYSMVKEKNIGTIILSTPVAIQKEKNMELDATHGMMDPNIQETGKKTKYMELENIHGTMEDNMKEIGKKIIWTEKVFTPGKMAENLKANT